VDVDTASLVVRIYFITELIQRTGLAPWQFESSFHGSPKSTILPFNDVSLAFTAAGPTPGIAVDVDTASLVIHTLFSAMIGLSVVWLRRKTLARAKR